jgi:hypothetical protein
MTDGTGFLGIAIVIVPDAAADDRSQKDRQQCDGD